MPPISFSPVEPAKGTTAIGSAEAVPPTTSASTWANAARAEQEQDGGGEPAQRSGHRGNPEWSGRS